MMSQTGTSWGRWLGLAVAAALLVSSQPAWAQPGAPSYEPGPCSFIDQVEEIPATIECGTLVVPEQRAKADGTMVRVAVAVLKATGPDPQPDPVVYLAGGPGAAGIESISSWLQRPLLDKRDVILVDQRGSGASEPLCPDTAKELMRIMAQDLSVEEEVAKTREAVSRCVQSLRDRGVEPTAYHSVAAAADLEDLRGLLGYEKWNLLGVSYGTRLALTAMRDFPAGVRSAVLDSTFPPAEDFYRDLAPHFVEALYRLAAECTQSTQCGPVVGDLEAELRALLAELADQPIRLHIDAPEFFPDGTFVVNPQDLQFVVRELGSARTVLPAFVRAWRQGKTESLAVLLKIMAHMMTDHDTGKYFAVQCHEEMPFSAARHDAVPPLDTSALGPFASAATAFHSAAPAVCADWPKSVVDPKENQAIQSAIPTLLLAGELDYSTPPEYAERAVSHLAKGTVVRIPGAGHASLDEECIGELVAAYLDAPEKALDMTCVDERQAAAPIGALHLTSGPLRLLFAVRRGNMGPPIWLAASLLLLAPAIVFWPGRAAWRWRRRKRSAKATPAEDATAEDATAEDATAEDATAEDASDTGGTKTAPGLSNPKSMAHLALGLAAFAAWAFCLELVSATLEQMDGPYAMAILAGLPADVDLLFLLPKAIAVLTVGGIVAAALAWQKMPWSRFERVHYVLTSLAAVAFVAFLATYDLW